MKKPTKRIMQVMMICLIAAFVTTSMTVIASVEEGTPDAPAKEVFYQEVESEDSEEDLQLTELVEAEDVETALSDMTLGNQPDTHIIYYGWGLMIVAVFGGYGYIMYRRFRYQGEDDSMDDF